MNLQVFYHCALMPGALPIAKEQIDLAAWVDLCYMRGSLVGPEADRVALLNYADSQGVTLFGRYESNGFTEFEYPTLTDLWNQAKAFPDDAFLYWHTKGASLPGDARKRHWRRVLQKWVVAAWQENVRLMENHDAVSANYMLRKYHHFSGNFWMARGDWVSRLPDPRTYINVWLANQIRLGRPNRCTRFPAETWLLSRPGARVSYSVCRNIQWGAGPHLFSVPTDIPGFQYDDALYHDVAPVGPPKD